MVYLTMDMSDVVLAAAKIFNYMQIDIVANTIFAGLIVVWTYTRHYMNLVLLWSVWYEFDKLPLSARRWSPRDGVWLAWWMKYQIFIPIVLLQIVNLFWYFLILRIAYRTVVSSQLVDERSDDEDEGPVEQGKKKD